MKRFALLTLLIGISSAFSFAQNSGNVTVKGSVVDKEDGSPVMQATVQLLNLPDSTMAVGNVTDNDGAFSISAKPGKYALKVSFVGYLSHVQNVQLTSSKPTLNVGKISLASDAIMLSEAVVTAEAPQVTVSGDTLGFTPSAYRTPEGAMLEELVRKLPGAEVDESGNVKINGKSISKIMVDGKEFFGGDVQTGLQNLPVDMIEKISAYDRQSDMARVTGIDDGEEETVLDLTVKKGMNKGWFGNIDGGMGTEDRYSSNATINRFNTTDESSYQLTMIGGANNVGSMRFSGGGGGGFRRNNGLASDKRLGMSFASETEKLEVGGSVQYTYRDNDSKSIGQVENFLLTGNSSFANSNSASRSKNKNIRGDFRLEWRPDSVTNILFRANGSWGDSYSLSDSKSETFNSDPYAFGFDPMSDALTSLQLADLDAIRVNTSTNRSLSDGNSLSGNASLQINRRLSDDGRNITFRGTGSYGENDSDRYSDNLTEFFNNNMNDNVIKRYVTTPTNNYSLGGQLTYSEPIAEKTYLQFSYQFTYRYNESDNSTYDLGTFDWNLGQMLPNGYQDYKDEYLSTYSEYKNYIHDARVTLRINRETWRLSAGVSFRPQTTKLSYKGRGYEVNDTTRNVFNFSPEIDFRYQPERQTQLRFSYRGRSSEPSMENLLPIRDDSNPLNIRIGNPGLKPSFSHNINLNYNTYDMDTQRGIFSSLGGSFTQNSISQIRQYNESEGAWTTMPENINGNWNANAMFGMNTALKNRKFTINTNTFAMYTNNVGYLTKGDMKDAVKNTTTNLMIGERLGGAFRNDWLWIELNGSFNYTFEKDKLNPQNNQEPYTFSYGGNFQVYTPWNMTITTNLTNQARRGYRDSSMNRNELIWNASIQQSFLKGSAILSLELYDILKEQSNITRSLTSSGRSVYTYNGVNSYVMLRFTYRLNIFGDKSSRRNARGGFGGPGMGGPGMGMPPGGMGGGMGGGMRGGMGGMGGGRRF